MKKRNSLKSIIHFITQSLIASATDPKQLSSDMIDPKEPFSSFRFNKSAFLKSLSKTFKLPLETQILWEYPHIEELALYFAEHLGLTNSQKDEYIHHDNLNKQDPIAIIGIGCRFPGQVNNSDDFWALMLSGTDPITEVPASRWNINEWYDENYKVQDKMNSRFGGFLNDIDTFDASFFNISAKEALYMDPQQRLFLEVAWQAIENAALKPEKLEHTSTGVFVGVSMHDYERLILKSGSSNQISAYNNLGASSSAIGARLSYFLGLNGPSFAIDTACSSSMSALYQACMSLRSEDCDLALAGGVNLILDPDPTIGYSKAHMMAPDGRCKTFDKEADGYVRSEGCGVVILKKLDKAVADGNRIYAVIRSTMANQDGASNGITAPNMLAQKQMLKDALYCADLKPNDIDYFEAHGTGTFIGDPIEVDAINQVYSDKQRERPLYLGAIKSQIGHCEAAAGIAGIIKTVLIMQHQQIPPNLHFKELNPQIHLDKIPCIIPTELIRQPIQYAAVSSFGFTGTNTHAILERAPKIKSTDTDIALPKEYPFILSAKHDESLLQLIDKYQNYLSLTTENIGDICYTLALGRSHFNHRFGLSVSSLEDLREQIAQKRSNIHQVTINDQEYSGPDAKQSIHAYLSGQSVNWFSYYEPYAKALKRISLPTYCFNRKRYWIDVKKEDTLSYDCFYTQVLQERALNTQSFANTNVQVVRDISSIPHLYQLIKDTKNQELVFVVEENSLMQGVYLGFTKLMRWEHPEYQARCIVFDTIDEVKVSEELLHGQSPFVFYHNNTRFEPRIVRETLSDKTFTSFDANASYWITGGFGGLGLVLANWLAEHGAKHIVLTSRHGRTAKADSVLEQLASQGVSVYCHALDVTDGVALEEFISHWPEDRPPLKGLFHLAGINVQKPWDETSLEDLESVLAPKMQAAWQLHTLTQDKQLDYFVLFSSMASFSGSNRQAGYVIANSCLDALGRYRTNKGLPATVINWGP
ncbi:MAG: type I polyketide synthase, partial [Legionellales bacterium]